MYVYSKHLWHFVGAYQNHVCGFVRLNLIEVIDLININWPSAPEFDSFNFSFTLT